MQQLKSEFRKKTGAYCILFTAATCKDVKTNIAEQLKTQHSVETIVHSDVPVWAECIIRLSDEQHTEFRIELRREGKSWKVVSLEYL